MTIEKRLEQLEKRNKRLKDADLRGANLESANLGRADLEGAFLRYANLVDVRNLPELSAKQEEDACWSDCG